MAIIPGAGQFARLGDLGALGVFARNLSVAGTSFGSFQMALVIGWAFVVSDFVSFVFFVSLVRNPITQPGLTDERGISHKDHKGHKAHKQEYLTTCREVRRQAAPDFAQRRKERKVTQRGQPLTAIDCFRLLISGFAHSASSATAIAFGALRGAQLAGLPDRVSLAQGFML